jgi:3-oxoacyl-[acyl-carrier-protein] synthase II
MMKSAALITGIGILSPLGNTVQSFWSNLKNGVTCLEEIESIPKTTKARNVAGLVRDLDLDSFFSDGEIRKLAGMDITSQFVLRACRQALLDAQINLESRQDRRFVCAFGSSVGNLPTDMPERAGKKIGRQRHPPEMMDLRNQTVIHDLCEIENIDCPGISVSSNCSAGNIAIGYGVEMIRCKRADIAIVGGYEVFRLLVFDKLSKIGLLTKETCRPFEKRRDGMFLGEGVGVLILESKEAVLKAGKKNYGEIIGFGAGSDAYHTMKFSPVGKGVNHAVNSAMADAGIDAADIDLVIADAKGMGEGDRAEAFALKKVFGEGLESTPVTSFKSQTTHCMGASGPHSVVAGLFCLKENFVPSIQYYKEPDAKIKLNLVTHGVLEKPLDTLLVNAVGLGGNAGSLIIRQN